MGKLRSGCSFTVALSTLPSMLFHKTNRNRQRLAS